MVISKAKGLIRDATYCSRLYDAEKITERLKFTGFSPVKILKGFVSHDQRNDYGLMTNRVIVIADKE